MEKVKVGDIVNNLLETGTVIVKSACENMEDGNWFCVTHRFVNAHNQDYAKHFEDGTIHLTAWACNLHGVEVP